jgi:hypothetical protein
MTPEIWMALGIFLAVDFVALAVFLAFYIRAKRRRRKILHFGDAAEKAVSDELAAAVPNGELLNDVYLPSGSGVTQIDHILLCKWGVFVVETKSHNGKIVIGQKEWVQIYGEKVVRFHSPVMQNEIHVKALRAVLSAEKRFDPVPVRGVVVFTSKKARFSKQVKGVIRLDQLNSFIKKGEVKGSGKGPYTAPPRRNYLSSATVAELKERILEASRVGLASRRRHDKAMQSMDRNH